MRDQRARRVQAWCIVVAAVLVVFVVLASLPTSPSGDDRQRREAVFALAAGHGHVTKYALIMPMMAAVPYRVGRALGLGTWVLDNFVLLLWVPWSLLLGARLARLRDVKFAVGVVTLTTISMFALYVTLFNVEAFALMLVSYGALLVLDDVRTRTRVVGMLLLAVGAASVPVQALALGVVGVVLLLRRRNVWCLLAAVIAVAISIADATWTKGHFSISKYPSESYEYGNLLQWGEIANFGFPIVFGLVGVLFSFGRGLLWFQPAFFARSVDDRDDVVRRWRRTMTLFVVVMIPVYSKWWAWYGGFSFGPRFFLLAVVPAAVVVTERLQLARSVGSWLVGVALAAWSAWVAIAAAVFYLMPATNLMCRKDDFANLSVCWYFSEYSPLLNPLWEHWHLVPAEVVMMMLAPAAVGWLVWWLTPRDHWRVVRRAASATALHWTP